MHEYVFPVGALLQKLGVAKHQAVYFTFTVCWVTFIFTLELVFICRDLLSSAPDKLLN